MGGPDELCVRCERVEEPWMARVVVVVGGGGGEGQSPAVKA